MKSLITLCLSTLLLLTLSAQEDFNLELLANVSVGEDGNDIWGFVDSNGIEYAAMGSETKVSIFSLENPSNPILRQEIPGDASIWRDMKHYKNHIYFTTDTGNDGLGIIDMTDAPETITSLYWTPSITINAFTENLETCHNLFIDENGFCYLAGCNVPDQENTNGIIILDLNQDPEIPVIVGDITRAYSHDVYVRDNILYSSEINNGEFGIYDVTDKANPQFIVSQATSSDYTHNAWLSDDGNFLYTTDELENSFVDGYDISDFNNIRQTDTYRPLATEGNGVIPHNTHFINNYLVTSWYTDGVVITDVSDPNNIVKVGAYDTFKGEENIQGRWFHGTWGAYPWLPSGIILVSDINTGLYVFQPTYQRASRIEGTITDIETGASIPSATVRMLDQEFNLARANANGEYKGGDIAEGEQMFEFSHPLYFTDTFPATLLSGTVTILDVQLQTLAPFIDGRVVDSNGSPIPFAKVEGFNVEQEIDVITDSEGNFKFQILDLPTSLFGGSWGYHSNIETLEGNDIGSVEIVLQDGYKDEFAVDLGWESIDNAGSGAWVRDAPIGTTSQGMTINPGSDVTGDLGTLAYVTGNDGNGGVGNDDVDDGTVTLISPTMDLSTYVNPKLSFAYWFTNEGGNSTPNDNLEISLLNNNTGETITLINTDESIDAWILVDSLFFKEYLTDLSSVSVQLVTSDEADTGHLVEAAFDIFEVIDEEISSTNDITLNDQLNLYPNPATDKVNLVIDQDFNPVLLSVNSREGKTIYTQSLTTHELSIDIQNWPSGLYFAKITGVNGRVISTSFTVE